jgi:adenylate cyclase
MKKASLSLPPGWIQARRYHLLAPLVALALVFILDRTTTLVDLVEDMTVNLRFQARAPFDSPADPRLIFVGIDELSLSYLGKWPWPRNVQADFLKNIAASGTIPHTVAFDVLFSEESNKGVSAPSKTTDDQDAALGDAVALLPSVITGALIPQKFDQREVAQAEEKRTQEDLLQPGPTASLPNVHGNTSTILGSDIAIFPVPVIRSQSLFGFVNDNPSPVDDIRHTLPLVVRVRDKFYPSLALQTLCQLLDVDASNVDVDLSFGVIRLRNSSGKTWKIPINASGEFAINYRRESSFHSVSFFGLLQNLWAHVKKGAPIAKDCAIANKALFVGESATSLGDMGPSPLASRSPLPYAHLNVINNVLQNDYRSSVPLYLVVAGWLVITWSTLLRLKVAPLVEAVSAPIVLVLIYIVIAFAIFWVWSVQIALAWPVLSYTAVNFGGVVLRWREEQKGRQQIKGIFSQMVSPEVMNHLMKNPENMQLGGADRPSTILFSDIRDYTGFSEGKTAAEVMRQLNIYFERMVTCITERKGTVHKFIGDAIMAAWGDIADASQGPVKDAQNAVNAALLMRVRLGELNAERKEQALTPIRIGVGLNHGVVQAGMLGSTGRKEFTMIGDEVNVASRLEGITKEFHTDLAISESVKLLIGDDFLVRRLGFIQLKGKTQATLVYEVLAQKSNLADAKMTPEGVARYEEAFDHFLSRNFAKAESGFLACQKEYPNDYCVNEYLTASREFSANPPPPQWDGRIVMKTK